MSVAQFKRNLKLICVCYVYKTLGGQMGTIWGEIGKWSQARTEQGSGEKMGRKWGESGADKVRRQATQGVSE